MKPPSIDTRRIKLATGLAAACLGFAALAGQGGQAAAAPGQAQAHAGDVVLDQATDRNTASAARSAQRGYLAQARAVVAQPVQAAPAAPAAPAPVPPPPAAVPAKPVPVAGLNQIQMNNAKKIVDTAKAMGLGKRAQVIAIATAMQESQLHNLASTRLPESYNYPNEGEGSDHDSVGLFQQRSSTGWGPVKDLMQPEFATRQFLKALVQVPGWESLPVTVAAQQVQVSAYPDHYAKHEWAATQVVDALQ